jgi:Ca2+-binding RTX toxin-like protein
MSAPKLAAVITSVVAATTALVSPGATADAAVTGSGSAPPQRVDVTLADCTITGTDYGEYLNGTEGDDVICGLGGNDTMVSSPGDDTYIGGEGIDGIVFAYTNVPNGVKADLRTGIATGHGTDTLDGVENLFGTPYRDTLRGDSQTYSNPDSAITGNLLVGNGRGDVIGGRGGGYDVLDGGPGNDTLIPGPGDDFAAGDNGIDTISFKLSTGPVTVNMDPPFGDPPMATGQGTDSLYGENIIGSPYDDTITGGAEGFGTNFHDANVVWGLAGNDTLSGGASGNDKLFGQAGNDALDGGTETDRCDGGPDSDTATACETLVSIP